MQGLRLKGTTRPVVGPPRRAVCVLVYVQRENDGKILRSIAKKKALRQGGSRGFGGFRIHNCRHLPFASSVSSRAALKAHIHNTKNPLGIMESAPRLEGGVLAKCFYRFRSLLLEYTYIYLQFPIDHVSPAQTHIHTQQDPADIHFYRFGLLFLALIPFLRPRGKC